MFKTILLKFFSIKQHLLFKIGKYLNFTLSKKINNVKVVIPVFGNIGLTNLVLKKNWLDLLIKEFTLPKEYIQGNNSLYTFIDVGVNIGQTLLHLKTIYPEINYLGFEPNSTCTAYVQKLIKINNFKNCTVQNVALSTGVGILQLEKDSVTDTCASVISSLRPNYFPDKEQVLSLDYQSFYLEKNISFVKIDVEGAEYEVLKGMEKAILRYQPIITCEVLDSHCADAFIFTQERATKLCQMLKSWNYDIIRLQTESAFIVDYEKIDKIKIIQWTQHSYTYNDYIFYPSHQENSIIEKLRFIKNK